MRLKLYNYHEDLLKEIILKHKYAFIDEIGAHNKHQDPRKRVYKATLDGEIVYSKEVIEKEVIVKAKYTEEGARKCVCCDTPTHRFTSYTVDAEERDRDFDVKDFYNSIIRKHSPGTKLKITVEALNPDVP